MKNNCSKQKEYKIILKVVIFIAIIITIAFPFLLEKILFCENVPVLNKKIVFSREVWFGFMASYIGAIATILLGMITLYINKKYNELAKQSSEQMDRTIAEIKKIIWQNNMPILRNCNKIINENLLEKSVHTLDKYWELSDNDQKLHLKFIEEQISKDSISLHFLKTYELEFENLSEFPIQSIEACSLYIRDEKNAPKYYSVASQSLQGYVDAKSSIICEIEIYDILENKKHYNDKCLELGLTILINDSKGYRHKKFYQLISVKPEIKKEGYKVWDDVFIISEKIETIDE